MVVCKCRKATKQYCFVHKTPVCGECICFPEHQICVVRTYSEWVIDGEYDWPPKCCLCQVVLEEGSDSQTTRLGCLHVLHTRCLDSHIKGCPTNTAPAGYVCPACSTPVWPPKSFKDSGSTLHSKLKEAIMQSGLEKYIFGNHPAPMPAVDSRAPPPAFATDPPIQTGNYNSSSSPLVAKNEIKSTSSPDIVEIDVSGSAGNSSFYNHEPNFIKTTTPAGPGATTRKTVLHVDRQNSDASSYFADDEDMNRKKYSRRGPLGNKFFRKLLPFWSSTSPILPVTRKDAGDDTSEGRLRQQKTSRMDPRRIILVIAIMACMGTMGILYYRLAQRGLGEEQSDNEKP